MSAFPKLTPHRRPDRRGMALVITLASLLLLSILVLTFFSRANLNRQISFSGSTLVETEVFARSALDLVAGELGNEIMDPARSDVMVDSGISIYRPKTAAQAMPSVSGVSGGTGSLLKVSANATPFYPGSLLSGSSIGIEVASANGRRFSASRWFTSATSSPQLGSQAVMPTWAFVTRGNGVKTPAIADAKDIASPDFVIGRLAWTVYDVSGLLDINVAGYPAAASVAAAPKGPAVWADLSAFPGLGDPEALAQWIHAGTKDTFAAFATGDWPASGFRQVAALDTAFLGRRDLINYAQANPGKVAPAALPLLTTFTRSVNAPSWEPAKDLGGAYNYQTNKDAPTSLNRFFPNVRVKTTFTRRDGTPAVVGEPLVGQRFPLGKLALLSGSGTDAEVSTYFGLTRATPGDPWVYRNNAATILTLDQVAALNPAREPDFFELLQACLLSGSLGKYGSGADNYSLAGTAIPDSNTYLQTIRIGANIIDQADVDNYPSIVTFNGYKLAGIEDIPYPNEVLIKWNSTAPYTTAFSPEVYFELWNPHQPSATTGPGPSQFRVVVNPDARYRIGFVNPANGGYHSPLPITAMPSATKVLFTANSGGYAAANSYREPTIIRGGSPALSFPTTGDKANGFTLNAPPITFEELNWYLGLVGPVTANPYGKWQYAWDFFDTVFSFQYQNASNQWVTYATTGGLEELPSTGLRQSTKWVGVAPGGGAIMPEIADPAHLGGVSLVRSDPRTWRFGVATGKSFVTSGASTYLSAGNHTIPAPNVFLGGGQNNPWGPYTYAFRLDLWSQNKSTTDSTVRYNDRDGALRPGDCYLDDASQPMRTGEFTARPIIMNRPFRSVGELGYVFRDIPWKTLDLFSADSPDAALLDVFSVEETKVVAGRMNPNTTHPEVLAALVTGVKSREIGGVLQNATEAQKAAQAVITSTGGAGGPLVNSAELATRFAAVSADLPATGKAEREALVRALASAGNTRTWNVLIDLVAQTGRYATNAADLTKFTVEGERRYWMHVAIDRYTGRIVDQTLETVDE